MGKKVLLVILDGWGLTPEGKKDASAINAADTPFMDQLMRERPNSRLQTHGIAVGLPEGQMGNSEVGHMNLGAGRVVYQDLLKINLAIKAGQLKKNSKLLKAFEHVKSNNKRLHILGVASDGGIHGHIDHMKHLATLAAENKIKELYIHAFTDGRDTDPKSGAGFISDLQEHLEKTVGKIATVTGRYYAMDRDTRWERTALAYHALVNAKGRKATDLKQALKQSYGNGETDEFIKPIIHTDENSEASGTIKNGDAVIFTNFRSDRARQLTEVLTQTDRPEQDMKKLHLLFLCFKKYEDSYKNIEALFESSSLRNILGEVLSEERKTQLRITETEKYAHVTYFFNNGREEAFDGEKRIIISSPRDVDNYDEKPEMSAEKIRDVVITYMKEHNPDFICLNFANPDMVGHTGNFDAAIKACEIVDRCTQKVIEQALENDYITLVLADHGNADYMKNKDGSPNTNHTTNPVPCILVQKENSYKLKDGKLSDVAPTILKLMEIDTPEEMTGDLLLKENK